MIRHPELIFVVQTPVVQVVVVALGEQILHPIIPDTVLVFAHLADRGPVSEGGPFVHFDDPASGEHLGGSTIDLCTIGMSLPVILKTHTSPVLNGSFPRFKNRMSPLKNRGSIEPLSTTTTGLSASVNHIKLFQIMSAEKTIMLRLSIWEKRTRLSMRRKLPSPRVSASIVTIRGIPVLCVDTLSLIHI
eukprot:TRINITY_DN12799_c0_g1_i1.p2 TRINITY_DN12799_c0_g1~~TRINITY_DN12799_c0_g1_i1.p2  ORF type:complete len:189 (+),score=28.43 TRINITY_DN12799_c0_g1_i1:413-979(+)